MPTPRLPSWLNSVRGRLYLLIAALTVPSLAIIGALAVEMYDAQQRTIHAELSNTARAVAGVIDAEMERSVAILRALASTRSVQTGDWESLDEIGRRLLPEPGRWLVVVDMAGTPLVNTRVPRGESIPSIKLDPAYIEAMQAGRPFVSDLIYGPAAQKDVVHVGVPVVLAGGRLLGVSLVSEPHVLAEALNVRRYAPNGVVTVADRKARIVSRSPYRSDFIGSSPTADITARIQSEFDGVAESVTLEGLPVFAAFTHAQCGWSVAMGSPKAAALAATMRVLLVGVSASLLLTLLGVGIARWIGGTLLRNVEHLAADAERLALRHGALSNAPRLREIESIARALERLAATRDQAEEQERQARDRLQAYANQLEQHVAERTASLREAMTQMEEFSYSVSHDLRAPIRAIHGYAELLLEEGASEGDRREYLRRIVRASARMNALTTGMLNYSRIAKADLQRSRVGLEPVLRGTIEHYAELQPAAADVKVITPLHDVVAHELSLTQALSNLLTNATKFVRPGQRPAVTVRTERLGDRVRVWVEDNGIGIPPQHQQRLFRVFERTPEASQYDGTGIGLAIVRKVIEKSGGACGVESDGQNGSRFWIELPAAE